MKESDFIKLIAKALEVDEASVTPTLELGQIPEWDSLGHLTILTALDDAIDGRLDAIPNFSKNKSVDSMLSVLRHHRIITE